MPGPLIVLFVLVIISVHAISYADNNIGALLSALSPRFPAGSPWPP
jgi:hypothetical protein